MRVAGCEPVLELLVPELVCQPGHSQQAGLASPVQEGAEPPRSLPAVSDDRYSDVIVSPDTCPEREGSDQPASDAACYPECHCGCEPVRKADRDGYSERNRGHDR
jgi:hypothetical protein